jgi:dolichol kinase
VPIGYLLAGLTGVVAAAVASYVERYEYKNLDDNFLISIVSSIILIVGFIMQY